MNKIIMTCLCFELTRRCNMNCDWCCRGDAQDINITNEIIDKTLDEVSNFEICVMRMTGGEPFLNKDGLVYLVDQIIKRKMNIVQICIFTNGTVKDKEIKEKLLELAHYIDMNRKTEQGRKLLKYYKNNFRPIYNTNSIVDIIVSTYGHKDIDLKSVFEFYNDEQNKNLLWAYNQTDSFEHNLTNQSYIPVALEGKVLSNYEKFIKDEKWHFKIMHNQYCIIDDTSMNYDNIIKIKKTLTISANGNVFVGGSQSFVQVDNGTNLICNINQCKNDLYKKIDDFSWRHPLQENQKNQLANWLLYKWLYEHDIPLKNYISGYDVPDKKIYEVICMLIEYAKDLENTIRYVHEQYPLFLHWETNMMAVCSKALHYWDNVNENKDFYLKLFDETHTEAHNRDTIENVCKGLMSIYRQRRLEVNPLYRFLCAISE